VQQNGAAKWDQGNNERVKSRVKLVMTMANVACRQRSVPGGAVGAGKGSPRPARLENTLVRSRITQLRREYVMCIIGDLDNCLP